MGVLKVSVDGKMRRLDFGNTKLTITNILDAADVRNCKALISWVDDEGDKVYIETDSELQEALALMNKTQKYARLSISTDIASQKVDDKSGGSSTEYRKGTPECNFQKVMETFSKAFSGGAIGASNPVNEIVSAISGIFANNEINQKSMEEIFRIFEKKNESNCSQTARNSHLGVVCDGCDQSPIRGLRFKCRDCDNFDLCSNCRFSLKHDEKHSFENISPPFDHGLPIEKAFSNFLQALKHSRESNARQGRSNSHEKEVEESKDVTGEAAKSESSGQRPETSSNTGSSEPPGEGFELVGKKDNDYSKELGILQEMGFKDEARNLKLLKAMEGNLRNVLQALFSITD